nr:MAG TPA: hypothetical protein [Caudoviricetes sp.]
MIEKKTIMKARGKEGEQINAEHELQHLCEVFHETAMTVWNVDEESVKMSLPYHFTDGAPAMISARMMLDGKVRVSDDHLIAMHEPLTPSKIREICKEQGLDYSLRDFEMYTVVDKKAFCDAVWKIIGAIVHAHDIAMER